MVITRSKTRLLMLSQKKMRCRHCYLLNIKCDDGSPCSTCITARYKCTYDKIMVNGKGMYLRDDGRTRDGEFVTPDDPAAAPQAAAVAASAPYGSFDESLPIAPLHLWRDFGGASVLTPVSTSGTPFPWTPSAPESSARWQDFLPKQSSEGTSLPLRQAPSSGGTKDDGKKDEEAEEDGNSKTANAKKVSWRKRSSN